MSAPAYAARKAYYTDRWQHLDIPAGHDLRTIRAAADKILANKPRYLVVSRATGVPWFVIGCIHSREGSCNFATHLHNGDPLDRRTRNVPAGRPTTGTPPFTWEASAKDALEMRGLHKVPSWELERCLYEWEAYNGWGYEMHQRPSPYLWANTAQLLAGHDVETKGKYVRDHVYDPNATDLQAGCAGLLKLLMSLDASVSMELTGHAPEKAPAEPVEKPKANQVPRHPEPQKHAPAPVSAPLSELLWKLLLGLLKRILK